MISKIFEKFFKKKVEKPRPIEPGSNSAETEVTSASTLQADNASSIKEKAFSFQRITAQDIAQENGLEYISDVFKKKLNIQSKNVNSYFARGGKYILLHPANDGMPTCPFEWFGIFGGKIELIMHNQSSFKCITNLDEIILQMVKLYTKYIDEDVFIASAGFAIRLDDKVTPNYHGKASLVLTDDSIRNNKVKPNQITEAKKYFINGFLDHYLGWNFGVVITEHPALEKVILDFNELVIQKGLREEAKSGFEVWSSEDVKHYNFKTT